MVEYLILDGKVIGTFDYADHKTTVNYQGTRVEFDDFSGSGSLFTLKKLPPEPRIQVVEAIAKYFDKTREDFIKGLIFIDVHDDPHDANALIGTAKYGDIEMKLVARFIGDDITIIEFPRNITIPQFSMFEKYQDRMVALVKGDGDKKKKIKEFLKDYATDYVYLTIEEMLF